VNISRVHPIHKRYRPRSDVTRDRVRTIKEEIAAVDPRFRSVGLSLYFEPHRLVHPHGLQVEMLPNDSLRVWPVPLLAAPIFFPGPNGTKGDCPISGCIIFSRVGRAAVDKDRTNPMAVDKFNSDALDLDYLAAIVQDTDLETIFLHWDSTKYKKLRQNLTVLASKLPSLAQLLDRLPQ